MLMAAAAAAVPSRIRGQRRERDERPPGVCRPGPEVPRGRPDGRSEGAPCVGDSTSVSRETELPRVDVSRETEVEPADVSRETESACIDVSRETRVPVAGAVESNSASAARAASMRPATSEGILVGPGSVPSSPRISSRDAWTSAHRGQPARWSRSCVVRNGVSSPSVRSEISETSGCSSEPVVDVTLAHLRPSRHLCRSVLPSVGRVSPAPGSFPGSRVGYPRHRRADG